MSVANGQHKFAGGGLAVAALAVLGLLIFAALTSGAPQAAVGLAVGLVAIATALRWHADLPKLGLYVFVGLVPLSAIGAHLPFPLVDSLTKAVFLASFGLLLVECALTRRRFSLGAQGMAGILFGGAAVLSYLLNEKTAGALTGLVRLTDLVLLLLLGINVLRTGRDVAILFAVIVATCLVSAAGGLLLPLASGGTAGSRLAGWTIQNDAPTFGFFVTTAVLICLYYLMTDWRSARTYWLFPATGFLIFAIVLTLSRGAVIALLMTAAYMLLRLRRRLSLAFVAVSLLALALMTPLIPEAFHTRMRSMMTRPGTDAPIQWRLDSARVGFALFVRNPLVGCGPGNFTEQYLAQEFRFDRPVRTSVIGNTYVSIMYDTGLVGLAGLALLIGTAWWNLRYVRRSYRPDAGDPGPAGVEATASSTTRQAAEVLEFLLLAFLTFSLFQPGEKAKYFWIILAASAVLARIRRGELAGSPPVPALGSPERESAP